MYNISHLFLDVDLEKYEVIVCVSNENNSLKFQKTIAPMGVVVAILLVMIKHSSKKTLQILYLSCIYPASPRTDNQLINFSLHKIYLLMTENWQFW